MLFSNIQLWRSSPRSDFGMASRTKFVVGVLLLSHTSLALTAAGAEPQVADPQVAKSEASQGDQQKTDKSQPADPKDEATPAPKMKSVRGRVVDPSGKPVPGTRLWLQLQGRPHRYMEVVADPSGGFEFTFPVQPIRSRLTDTTWTVWAYSSGYSIGTANVFDVVRGMSEREVEIKLGPEASTRFKVLTAAGEPVEGVQVGPQNYKTVVGYELVPEEMLPAVSSTTDKEGLVTLPAIEAAPLYRIQLEHEKFGKQAASVDRAQTDSVRTINLREPGRVEGKLTGERPEWLRQVRLVFATENDAGIQGIAEVVTDEEGRFTVPKIASGSTLITHVEFDPSLPVRPLMNDKRAVIAGQTLTIEIPFVPAPKVFGTVQTKLNGAPVPDAEISLSYGGFGQRDHAVTDKNGRFEGRVLPGPVRAQIISMPSGHVQLGTPWANPYEVPKGVDQFKLPTIEVVGTKAVKGKVVDDEDRPLAEMEVRAIHGNRVYGFAKTDTDGHFTLQVPDGVETKIEASDRNRRSQTTTVVSQDPLVLRYAADPRELAMDAQRRTKADVTLTGRVFAAGKPLAGVKLTLNRGIRHDNGMRIVKVSSAESDAQGGYRLTGLKAGDPYQIEVKPPFLGADPAWHHQLPWIPSVPETAQGEIKLDDINLAKLSQTLSGRVVDPDGKPVADATVSAMLRNGTSIPRNFDAGTQPWTETDQDGRFTLQQLPDFPLLLMAYMRNKAGGQIRFPAKVNVDLNQQDIRIVLDPSLTEEGE